MRPLLALLALLTGAPTVAAAELVETGRIALEYPDLRFGGLSGLDLDPDGEHFVAVGDRGILVTGRILREGERLTGAEFEIRPLRDLEGEPLKGHFVDAESVALDGAGGLHVGFEARHRIWHYAGPDASARRSAGCPDFLDFQINSGLEALARGPDGTLYAIPERSGARERPFPVYRIRGATCLEPFALPRRGPFLVTGADVGPDGRLYIVERDFALFGFATRIRRFAIGEARLGPEEMLLETAHGAIGNLEGIAAWRDGEGRMRLTLIADNNFSPLQETVLIEFRIEE
ncbi:MAG TPA: esterase-like activity of phytase family protein [Paracoccaceae bacterium]|nr:esterase-like activity of phytase family protein [Paracoccaceae bacterium]